MTDDRLKQALADLGIDLEPRRGWEGRVLVAVGVPWWERFVIRIWRARDLTSRLKEFIMTRQPKKLPAVDAPA
jgi:hypothetical protein